MFGWLDYTLVDSKRSRVYRKRGAGKFEKWKYKYIDRMLLK